MQENPNPLPDSSNGNLSVASPCYSSWISCDIRDPGTLITTLNTRRTSIFEIMLAGTANLSPFTSLFSSPLPSTALHGPSPLPSLLPMLLPGRKHVRFRPHCKRVQDMCFCWFLQFSNICVWEIRLGEVWVEGQAVIRQHCLKILKT